MPKEVLKVGEILKASKLAHHLHDNWAENWIREVDTAFKDGAPFIPKEVAFECLC